MRKYIHFTKTNFCNIGWLRGFCLLCFLFFSTALAFAGNDQQTITLNVQNASLEKVFAAIEKQTHYSFLYIRSVLKNARQVNLKVSNAPIEKVLELCFRNQPQLTYSIMDNVVVVKVRLAPTNEGAAEKGEKLDPIDVSGRVTDDQGKPLLGANVKVQGSKVGVVTDAEGKFILHNVNENGVLEISFVGHESQFIYIRGNRLLNINLVRKQSMLDETVVIAYGTTTKKLNTGNVTTVKGNEIANQPVSNPLLALQGRVPGLVVTQSTGMPGSGITVRIQGVNSITKGNDPLYVIDGVPYTSQMMPTLINVLGGSGGGTLNGVSTGSGNPLNFINPLDIESVEILKDADATSIYGSRAANGAILITTKKGKTGKTGVDFNIRTGWGKVANKLDLLETDDYMTMRKEAIVNNNRTVTAADYDINGVWDTTRNTDWYKELIGKTASYLDASVSVTGGNSNTQFLVGSTYHKETTVFPGNFNDQKGSVHFSINNTSTNNKFKFTITGSYLSDNNKIAQSDLTLYANLLAPTAPPLYNEDGSLNWAPAPTGASTWTNPLSYLLESYTIKTTNILSNAVISYQVLKNLQIRSSFGYTSLESDQVGTSPLSKFAPEQRPLSIRSSAFGFSQIKTYIIEPQLVYTNSLFKGKMELLLGTTFNESKSSSTTLFASGFNNDLVLEDFRSAATISSGNTFLLNYKYNAVFGRLNYNWNDKYVLNFTARRDGSSRFGSENLFQNFWSVGGAWIFSKERFLQDMPVLSFGKLRASYGISGNDQIGDYQFMNLYSPQAGIGVPYQGTTGLIPDRLTNPAIQWEETNKFQVGLELGFIRDRIFVNANFYRNRSSNQLLQYSLPITTGFTSISRNFPAKVENKGMEFSLNTINIQGRNFRWSTNINWSIVRNKLESFPDLESSTYATTLQIGQPVNNSRVYRFAGVNENTGIYQFYDANDNIISNPDFVADATKFIDRIPSFYGGFQNTFRFKGFEVDVLFQFVQQEGQNFYLGNRPGRFNTNQPEWVLNRWRKQGDNTDIQKFSTSSLLTIPFLNAQLSDIAWTDASYIRLKNISVSWTMPSVWSNQLKLQNLRLFAQGQNILTITSYKGLDPETLNVNVLPPLRVITLGVQTTL